jgi:hypothetical protein
MLDVHPPHEPVHGWRDFLVHLSTIAIGLLIALALEGLVEWANHRNEVAETREALHRELEDNRKRFVSDTAFARREAAMLANDLLVLTYVRDHPGSVESSLPGVLLLDSSYARMDSAAWKTAQATAVTALMPQEEVRRAAELYSFFERIDKAHEDEADAIAEAVILIAEDPNPLHLKPAQVEKELDLIRTVFAKHLRHGFLMQNLAEEYPDFRPGLSREELERWMHRGDVGDDATLQGAKELTQKRIDSWRGYATER